MRAVRETAELFEALDHLTQNNHAKSLCNSSFGLPAELPATPPEAEEKAWRKRILVSDLRPSGGSSSMDCEESKEVKKEPAEKAAKKAR